MARMGLAGAAGRWWGLALGLTAFFLPGKAIASASLHNPLPNQNLPGTRSWMMGKTTGCKERTEPEKLGHAWIRRG